MRVGEIVMPAFEGVELRKGESVYEQAVVLSLDPFKVCTMDGFHHWDDQERTNYISRQSWVPHATLNTLIRALPPEEQVRAPERESLMSNQLGCGLILTEVSIEPKAVELRPEHSAYGWLFTYKPSLNLWCAQRRLEGEELANAKWMHTEKLYRHTEGGMLRMLSAFHNPH